jgi:hypothetical protein
VGSEIGGVLLGIGVLVFAASEATSVDEGFDEEAHPEVMKKNVRVINNDAPLKFIWKFIIFPQYLCT